MASNCTSCKPGTLLPKCSVKIDAECVYYSGENLEDIDINTGNDLNSIIQKLADFDPGGGTVTSVAFTAPSAFSVSGSPITSTGTIAITGAGSSLQYIRGDGTLATFPTGIGSVTSVGLSVPAAFSITGSPITTSGTLAISAIGTSAQYIRGDGVLATLPVTTATNGLTLSGTTIMLGGPYITNIALTSTAFSVSITTAAANTSAFTVSNTGIFSAVGISSSATSGNSIGVRGTAFTGVSGLCTGFTGGVGIQGTCPTTGTAVFATSGGGTSIPIIAYIGGTIDATTMTALRLIRSGGLTLVGTGSSIDFQAPFTGGTPQDCGKIACVFTAVTSNALDFHVLSASTVTHRMRLTSQGYLGVGITSPAGVLHLAAGTTSIPSIQLTSSSLLSSPVNGAMEYDGTNLYFTTAGTRKIVLIGTVSSGGIYAGNGSIISPRTVDGDGFPLTFTDMGLFRIVQGNVTVGATYDFNTGVDFLIYDAANSSNLVMDSATGLEFQYTDLSGPTTLSSLKVDGVGVQLTGVVEFADNAAAIVGGLTIGYVYRTGDALKIVH